MVWGPRGTIAAVIFYSGMKDSMDGLCFVNGGHDEFDLVADLRDVV